MAIVLDELTGFNDAVGSPIATIRINQDTVSGKSDDLVVLPLADESARSGVFPSPALEAAATGFWSRAHC